MKNDKKNNKKRIYEDPIVKFSPEDKIAVGRVQEHNIYLRIQEYLKDHDAKLCHYEHFEGENFLGQGANGSKEIYSVDGATVCLIPYKELTEEKPRIIVTVSGDEKIKKEIKELFGNRNDFIQKH